LEKALCNSDGSIKNPYGALEDMVVGVDRLLFSLDFVKLEIHRKIQIQQESQGRKRTISKCLLREICEHLLLYAKFMEILPREIERERERAREREREREENVFFHLL